jgi:hypothetical protein
MGTPASTLFEASRANAETVAVVDPSLRMDLTLLDMVRDFTALVAAEEVGTTCTLTVAVIPEAVAVTVMVLVVESPAVDRVAVADPLASVVPVTTAIPPESAENVTATPDIRSFDALRASTVMVAVAEPSEGMEVALEVAVSDEAVAVPVVPVPVPVEPAPVIVWEPPPQPARTAAANQPMIDNLVMSFILARQLSAFEISRDLILHAGFSA